MQSRSDELRPDEQARLRGLIAACIEHIDREGERSLDAFLAGHPADAAFIRERVAALRTAGLLPAGGTTAAFPERLGDFRLLRRLGSGGMGVVYVAVQESLQREVALKMVRPEHLYFPGARERFRREVESVARLQHPGIVPIYLVGECNGVPFFAMELVRGKTLAEVIQALPRQDVADFTADTVRQAVGDSSSAERVDLGRSWVEAVLRIGLQVAEALAHAHERGVLHRDIKPSNVMLAPSGRALLLDFGLAVIEGAHNLTRTGHDVGSLPYMAPEQVLAQSDDIGPWTDVYGLGVLLYELLTLQSPFTAETTEATRSRILVGEPPLPHTLNPAIPWDAETICLKAIRRAHRQRYQSASALALDLRNFLALRPIAATRPGAADKLRTWTQRHPIKALLGVAGAMLLTAGPAAFAIQESFAKGRIRVALAQSEANFRRALTAVDELLADVGSRELRDVPQMDQIRARLLQRASQHYDAFLVLRPADLDLRENACRLAHTFGEAMQRLGKFDEAEKQQRRALELALARASELPGDPGARRLVATSHYSLGYLLMGMARHADAETAFTEAVRIHRELTAQAPQDHDLAAQLADALHNLGGLFMRTGRFDQAQVVFAEERDVIAPVAAAAPERSEFRERLGYAWQVMGAAHRMAGRSAPARAAHERALELFASLPENRRKERHLRLNEAITYRHLGDILNDLDDWPAAETALRHSIELRETLATDHPQVPEYRRDLALVRTDLGEKLLIRSRLAEAETELRQAIALLDPLVKQLPNLPEYHSHLGLAWLQLARVTFAQGQEEEGIEAFAVARRLQEAATQRDANDPGYRLRLANVVGLLGECLLEQKDYPGAARALDEAVTMLVELWSRVQVPAGGAELLGQRRAALAEALLGSRDLDRAAAVARDLAAGARPQRILAAGVLARIAAERRGEAADRAAQAAIDLLREISSESKEGIRRDAAEFAALRGREPFEALFR